MNRSSRNTSVPERRETAPVNSDNDQSGRLFGDESADVFSMPAQKRRKAKGNTAGKKQTIQGKASRQRVRGRLAAFAEMPLDILYEILRYMHPRDLLQVSRTTKTLRSVLMSKSFIGIWNHSHTAYDLPPVFSGMTVPQFVSLAYDRFCHFCSAPSVKSVIWNARVRCCKKCMSNEENFISEDDLVRCGNEIITRIMAHCDQSDSFYLIIPSTEMRDGRYYKRMFPTVFVRALYADYRRDDVEHQNGVEVRRWIADKQAQTKAIDDHAALCEVWDHKRRAGRDDELQAARDARKAEILRRLQDLGWADEIRHLNMTVFGEHELVRKPQPLSEKMWGRIQGPLVEYMKGVKTERLAQEKRVALCSRYDLLVEAYGEFRLTKPFRTVLPGIGDIVAIEAITRVIEDTPYDKDLPKSELRALLDAIPQSYFDDWREQCDAALVEVLNSSQRETPATKADLKLATTVFTPKDGSSDLSYPLVLVSNELTQCPVDREYGHDNVAAICRHTSWSSEYLKASDRQIVEQLVVLAGLDPKKATSEEMDELDPWYACMNHPDKGRYIAMTWRHAVSCPQCVVVSTLSSLDTNFTIASSH
ncbi:hypothetical protein BD626DRAFT_460226 [Schizophyllum amplum]|uniref:F-box domain-containing protein n=1 Tax=Schizophyllum amplum TaxID=97359 RepID=A0A550C9B8_9AGAR|nr:hypothetical protein BD626DRAFT_460226 [Auriculariopsis ampla]